MRFVLRPLVIAGSVLLAGCAMLRGYESPVPAAPSSTGLWRNSLTTDLPLWGQLPDQPFTWPAYAGYPDNKVLQARVLPDSSKRPFFYYGKAADPSRDILGRHAVVKPFETPGLVWVEGPNLLVDEVEVSNLEWQHFMNYLTAEQGAQGARWLRPHEDQLPRPDYFTDPFYRYYPVTGLSREQVETFCRWRSEAVTKAYNEYNHFAPTDSGYAVLRYRLPTEAEWEYAACGHTGLPYGVNRAHGNLRAKPAAAQYLRTRSGASQSAEQIRRDIKTFNRAEPLLVQFNCRREVPYFLALPTPGYVFDVPANYFGLYHMNGNVAELVQEPGLTKGGSYRDPLEACQVKARGTYTGPAPTVGFRCVCEVGYPNRR